MSEFDNPFCFSNNVLCHHGNYFVSSLEENDHLKAENRSLKKDLLTAIENGASGNKKVSLKGAFAR